MSDNECEFDEEFETNNDSEDDLETVTIVFNKRKVFRNDCSKVVDIVLKHDGLIYGGYVRDEIIKDHFTSKFFEKSSIDDWETEDERQKLVLAMYTRYWDPKQDSETADRLLKPKDIDAYFKTESDFNEFLDDLSLNSQYKATDIECGNQYFLSLKNIEHRKIKIEKTYKFLYFEYVFEISMDVCIGGSFGIEAPFGRLDFLCNGFVKTKEGIRLSKNTGTALDRRNVKQFQRIKAEAKIIDMIIEKKTIAVGENQSMVTRTVKILQKGFEIVNFASFDIDERCVICLGKKKCSKLNISFVCKECMPECVNSYAFIMGWGEERTDFQTVGETYIKTPMRSVVKMFQKDAMKTLHL